MRDVFKSTPVRWASILLIAQAALLYSSIRPEAVPPSRPLAGFPHEIGAWRLYQEGVVEPEVQEVLQADDLLNRTYVNPAAGVSVNLFIAAFRSQRNGKAPHSPKNCLPGAGWTQVNAGEMPIDVGLAQPIVVNRYEVQHEESRALVLYWYQSRDRVVANEFRAKFWVIADAIRLNRTDTALVRVTVPIFDRDTARAERSGVAFAQSFYPTIRAFLPQ
ncbi:MAG TPA: EpsI family protein [Bryobacteraceae bacterium]|nr:EpsI family protein [Bryobacteraceae bacterium]